jgi:hypothetical protein
MALLKPSSLIAALLPALAMASPLSITGPARAIDGDTVVVGPSHVRLKGVDARGARDRAWRNRVADHDQHRRRQRAELRPDRREDVKT